MYQLHHIVRHRYMRQITAVVLVAVIFMSHIGVTFAAGLGGELAPRSLLISDASVSGGSITSGPGSGVNVTYRVLVRAASTHTLKGMALDFCGGASSPVIGDSCTAPTGFSVGASPTLDSSDFEYRSITYTGIGAGWSASSANSNRTVLLENATGISLSDGDYITFAITGVVNPSAVGSFYGRLHTYTDENAPASYTPTNPGTYQDGGSFALSTTATVTINARVQEALTFCVSASTLGGNCSNATAPSIVLGHGGTSVLEPDSVDTASIFSLVSTNAASGVAIFFRNSNSCGGLSANNGSSCPIPPVNSGAGTPGPISAGTAAFGVRCSDGTGTTGAVDCDANYYDAGNPTYYGMDSTTVGSNTTTVYGDLIASSSSVVGNIENEYEFAATTSNVTPAGTYSANLAMIATGTF